MNEDRRRALGIPIHKVTTDHTFVDGYCVCGEAQLPLRRGYRFPGPRTYGKVDLDVIEGNVNR